MPHEFLTIQYPGPYPTTATAWLRAPLHFLLLNIPPLYDLIKFALIATDMGPTDAENKYFVKTCNYCKNSNRKHFFPIWEFRFNLYSLMEISRCLCTVQYVKKYHELLSSSNSLPILQNEVRNEK